MAEDGLKHARRLIDENKLDEAWDFVSELLKVNPMHFPALTTLSYIAWKAKRFVIGYVFGCQAVALAPQNPLAWGNLGANAMELWFYDQAKSAFLNAIKLSKDDKEVRGAALMSYAALLTSYGKFAESEEQARLALKDTPHSVKAKANLGMALLGQRKWEEGWKLYSYCLGVTEHREKMKFLAEPDWDGSPGKVVAFYGEQGLGDEISFASMLPDAIRDCKKVIFSCDKKVEGLFKRSFPNVRVYGTRRAKIADGVQWEKEDWEIDASLALGELGTLYRNRDEDFPGTAYLVPDPERRKMWRTLFDMRKKPVIGIAWTGGMAHTGVQFRTMTLDTLKQIFGFDAHWVSLEYKDASKEIAKLKNTDIRQYPWATLTSDYDDTAAMVAELDLVITVQTAVAHLCGAIGKECWVLLPKNGHWRYGDGETMPWYRSLKVFRQKTLGDWQMPLSEVVHALRGKFKEARAA